jgi:hypothetical protein
MLVDKEKLIVRIGTSIHKVAETKQIYSNNKKETTQLRVAIN